MNHDVMNHAETETDNKVIETSLWLFHRLTYSLLGSHTNSAHLHPLELDRVMISQSVSQSVVRLNSTLLLHTHTHTHSLIHTYIDTVIVQPHREQESYRIF